MLVDARSGNRGRRDNLRIDSGRRANTAQTERKAVAQIDWWKWLAFSPAKTCRAPDAVRDTRPPPASAFVRLQPHRRAAESARHINVDRAGPERSSGAKPHAMAPYTTSQASDSPCGEAASCQNGSCRCREFEDAVEKSIYPRRTGPHRDKEKPNRIVEKPPSRRYRSGLRTVAFLPPVPACAFPGENTALDQHVAGNSRSSADARGR